jgi:hypothetical protein
LRIPDDVIDGKYVVIPAETATAAEKAHGLPDDSFFVIRDSDVFGCAGLWSYAHTILTALEIDGRRKHLTSEEADRLRKLAHSLAGLLDDWSSRSRKIPD